MAELLKYKKQGNGSHGRSSRTKTKRVPTVKKELSTQKEILIGGNETQVPKTLVPPEDTANRLNEETEAIRRRNAESIGVSIAFLRITAALIIIIAGSWTRLIERAAFISKLR